MTKNHPMNPPNILLNQWENDWLEERENVDVLLIQAYQAGADAELEACCEWFNADPELVKELRADRRPKPPSLKEQALRGLEGLAARLEEAKLSADLTVLYRALEQLDD